MVSSSERGAVVFGPNGVRYLDEDRVEGEDPTTLFGEHTIMSLKREDAMEHAPDLLLLSQYDPAIGEVAAFEELIGSHGGLGGPQTEPFILHPGEWKLDEPVPLGAPAIYRNIRPGWDRSASRSGPRRRRPPPHPQRRQPRSPQRPPQEQHRDDQSQTAANREEGRAGRGHRGRLRRGVGHPRPRPSDTVDGTALGASARAHRRGQGGAQARSAGRHAAFEPRTAATRSRSSSAQEADRLQELLPLRHARMAESAFAYYRGTPAVMAFDLADDAAERHHRPGQRRRPPVELRPVRLARADARVRRERLRRDPPRAMGVGRQAARGEHRDRRPGERLQSAGREPRRRRWPRSARYREWMAPLRRHAPARRLVLARSPTPTSARPREATGSCQAGSAEISRRREADSTPCSRRPVGGTACKAFELADRGRRRAPASSVDDPPVVTHVEIPGGAASAREDLHATIGRRMPENRREFLERYRFVDFALKVVGVGSVGTRCFVVLLEGRDENDPLILQAKEATASVLEPYVAASRHANHGERVVVGQQLMQATSDIFLGWTRGPGGRDFYFRQLWDMKGSVDTTTLRADGPGLLRRPVRAGAGPGARAHRRRRRDRGVSGHERHVRWRDRRLLGDLRRPEREGLRGLPGGHRGRHDLRAGARRLTGATRLVLRRRARPGRPCVRGPRRRHPRDGVGRLHRRLLLRDLRAMGRTQAYTRLRTNIGRTILLGLEVLIVADIVLTVAIDQTIESAITLGIIVLVRTFLSFSLEIELEGVVPWHRKAAEA